MLTVCLISARGSSPALPPAQPLGDFFSDCCFPSLFTATSGFQHIQGVSELLKPLGKEQQVSTGNKQPHGDH